MLHEHEAKLFSSISAQAKPKKPVEARPRKSVEVNPTKPKAKKNQQRVCARKKERGGEDGGDDTKASCTSIIAHWWWWGRGLEVACEMLFVMDNATKMKFVMKGGNGALNRSIF